MALVTLAVQSLFVQPAKAPGRFSEREAGCGLPRSVRTAAVPAGDVHPVRCAKARGRSRRRKQSKFAFLPAWKLDRESGFRQRAKVGVWAHPLEIYISSPMWGSTSTLLVRATTFM